jgi:nucleoside-diphosphate-sugar epimerase
MILITGSNGFIGSKLVNFFNQTKRLVRGLSRDKIDFSCVSNTLDQKSGSDILTHAFTGIDTIIHCAAKVHIMNKTKLDTLTNYRLVNVEGTCRLAEKAVAAGVRRFIFLSSLKVSGTHTSQGKLFFSPDLKEQIEGSESDNIVADDPYVMSKFEAEQKLWKISAKTGLEVVIIRLPLVYGPGVKGNLARLIKLIEFNFPLPLASINNKRSMIGIENVVDLIVRCIDHPDAKGKTFLASDGNDIATPDLLRYVASSMGRSVRLFSFPISLLKLFGFVMRRQSEINRLVGSLQVDINYTKKTLNWTPITGVEEGIRQMVKGK